MTANVSYLARQIRTGQRRTAFLFAGQAGDYIHELRRAALAYPEVMDLVVRAQAVLADACQSAELVESGQDLSLPLQQWLQAEPSQLDPALLASSVVSQPLIFLTQAAHLFSAQGAGFPRDGWPGLVAAAGHSQGLMTAVLLSQAAGGKDFVSEVENIVRYFFWQGFRMQQAFPGTAVNRRHLQAHYEQYDEGFPSPMAAVKGITRGALQAAIDGLPEAGRVGPLVISLVNGLERLVVSGDPTDLVALRKALGKDIAQWEFLRTSAPFHSPYMEPALTAFRRDLDRLGLQFDADDLALPVLSTVDGANLQSSPDLTEDLLQAQFLRPVDFLAVSHRLCRDCDTQVLVDWGPQTTVARLLKTNVEGLGVAVLAAQDPIDRERLFSSEPSLALPKSWHAYAPRTVLLPGGEVSLSNRFTRATGFKPVFGGGMTPTTTTTEIVSAPAAQGYIVEWAGGGQVTESIFRARLDELCSALPEGTGLFFNALYLDPYLWKLHRPLLVAARAEGYPILGVTITGGIPPLDESVATLREFHAAGIRLNALKVGNHHDLERALQVADELGDQTLILQVEGGKAGGHHSSTPLEELLERHYSAVRSRANLLLAVGGGVADARQVEALLHGTWTTGPAPKPVDAVFVGTLLMACEEAHTSPDVKRALAQIKGEDRILGYGQTAGGVVSGRSGLDADIYYIGNDAAHAALRIERLVKDNPDSLADHEAEIIRLLKSTSKPYFGDLTRMTYQQVLERMVELMAPGDIPASLTPFGPWYDRSYHDRFLSFARRTLERFAPQAAAALESQVPEAPRELLELVAESAPDALATRLVDEDADAFVVLCRQPGKPVNFVPRVDGEVARWLTRDALWQSHDPRYPANAVFCVPGPAGVAGIRDVDEPAADILDRLLQTSYRPTEATTAAFAGAPVELPEALDSPLARRPEAAPILALALAPLVRFDGRVRDNFLRSWFASGDGRWTEENGCITFSCLRADHRVWWATATAGRLELSVPLGERGGHLTVTARFRPTAPAPLLFEPLEEPVTDAYSRVWNAGFVFDMEAFRSMVRGEQGNAPPICAAFPMAWNAITRQLFQELPPLNYLNLLHLEQEFVRPRLDSHQADQQPSAAIEAVEAHPLGTVISVVAASQLGLWSRSRFLVRGASLAPGNKVLEQPVWPAQAVPELPPPGASVTVDRQTFIAPRSAVAYARCSGDANPLHLSPEVASMAGYERPIMHGMWTLARALSLAVQYLGEAYGRLSVCKAVFLAPVMPGDELQFELRRMGPAQGGRWFQAVVLRGQTTVLSARVYVRPRRTAYLFTGQGSQFTGMGMELYQSSNAAREVWDRAEQHLKRRYGFSILQVVRDNPRRLRFSGRMLSHPEGVLHLTQFTQVAITLVEMAQVAHLKETGVYVDRAMFAGHSLGEYAALTALDILSLEWMVDVVYRRGLTMQEYVPRDREGLSPFAMLVVRPHLAGLDEAALLDLVSELGTSAGLLEVVNFNVRDRQYAVAGERRLLDTLCRRLDAGSSHSGRPAYVRLPGIDVPFHSSQLRDGVDAFRQVVQESIGESISPALLTGRYVPNLLGQPFQLTRSFVRAARDASQSPPLTALLDDWDNAKKAPEKLAATLLVELLSYQFASPVRWIETQDCLLSSPEWRVDDLVEIGPQAVLAGMAERTLRASPDSGLSPRILHVERDRSALFESEGEAPDVQEDTGAEPTPTVDPEVPATVAPEGPRKAPSATSGPGLESFVVTPLELLQALLAAKLEIPLPDSRTTIEELCQGNSARRNECLADLAAEYLLAGGDGVHTLPLDELAQRIGAGLPAGWSAPGEFTRRALEGQLPLRLGMRLEEALKNCREALGLTPEQAGRFLCLVLPELPAADGVGRSGALNWMTARLDEQLTARGLSRQVEATAKTGPTVSLDEVREELVGRHSPFRKAVEALARFSGIDLAEEVSAANAPPTPVPSGLTRVMERASNLLASCFDERKIVEFAEARTWLLRDMVTVAMKSVEATPEFARRFASFEGDERVDELAAYLRTSYRDFRHAEAAPAQCVDRKALLNELAGMTPLPGAYVLRPDPDLGVRFVLDRPGTESLWVEPTESSQLPDERRSILITGAGPGSIGESFAGEFLLQGRDVIVTTSAVSDSRTRRWRRLYARCASRGARLVVIPANQGLREDMEKVVETAFQLGLVPDLVLPFGAISQLGFAGDTDPGLTFAAHRIMLEGISELMSVLARKGRDEHRARPVHFLLPLSPNHGQFGGDGIYAELKLGLEALLFKARTEPLLAEMVKVAGLSIGWTRGTGLMGIHDDVSAALEAAHGVRTFSPQEIAGAALEMMRRLDDAFERPTILALHGGLERVENIGAIVAELKACAKAPETSQATHRPRFNPRTLGFNGSGATPALEPWPLDGRQRPSISPDRAVAIVGFGEVSPLGNALTRWHLETQGELSLEGAVELAWMMGLVHYRSTADHAGFIVTETGEPIADWEVKERFESRILAHSGIRFLEDDAFVMGPEELPVLTSVLLEQDFHFPVPDLAAAAPFLAANEQATVVELAGETRIRLPAGSVIRVPRALKLSRYAAGQVPAGWAPERFGIPPRVAQQVDRVTLFNLVASAEAFLTAGLTPEELRQYVHPAYIGNTQGSGMGGMASLASLYHSYREDRKAPGDVLQETLINVMAGWLVQDYIGSFGPSVHPVGACATAAVSLAAAWDLLQVGKADFVVAGGFDDLSVEGNLGFSSMQATAATDEMLARGIGARAMSRPNDARRDGFVESHGGATLLCTTVERAVAMGLPIYGCLAMAQTHNDGLQTSVPAPGKGLLALGVKAGRRLSPLERALDEWGLTVDDIRVFSKHDTSTAANDPNEAALLCRLMDHLGRKPGNPVLVHSQKSVLGHSKGGAAGWQSVAALQILGSGRVPGNPNLDDVDPAIAELPPLVLTDETVQLDRIPAVLATSLGFGHVGAALLFVHPALALDLLEPEVRAGYVDRVRAREQDVVQRWLGRITGHRPCYASRTNGPQATDLLDEVTP